MISILIILPIMFVSMIIVLISPVKLSHRFACSMETGVYLLIFLYSSLIIFVKEGVIENKLGVY